MREENLPALIHGGKQRLGGTIGDGIDGVEMTLERLADHRVRGHVPDGDVAPGAGGQERPIRVERQSVYRAPLPRGNVGGERWAERLTRADVPELEVAINVPR